MESYRESVRERSREREKVPKRNPKKDRKKKKKKKKKTKREKKKQTTPRERRGKGDEGEGGGEGSSCGPEVWGVERVWRGTRTLRPPKPHLVISAQAEFIPSDRGNSSMGGGGGTSRLRRVNAPKGRIMRRVLITGPKEDWVGGKKKTNKG